MVRKLDPDGRRRMTLFVFTMACVLFGSLGLISSGCASTSLAGKNVVLRNATGAPIIFRVTVSVRRGPGDMAVVFESGVRLAAGETKIVLVPLGADGDQADIEIKRE